MRWAAPSLLALLAACGAACGGAAALAGPGDLGLGAGRCAQQDDCPDGTICEPAPLGAATGTCMPPSTRQCADCTSDADCGAAALCFQGPGDIASACHVDCSLSWLACPTGYNCSRVLHDTGTRQVCLPIDNRCIDAGGSTCSAGETQPCMRSNEAGTCTGVRACSGGQLGPCGAPEPAFLPRCDAAPPAGCTELPSLAALSMATDCGACGQACPGGAANGADAACTDPATGACGISCRGDNYDLDGNPANGCEAADPDPANHAQTTATALPATDCSDSSSQNSFQGHVLSDTRVHTNPTVGGFDVRAGAAPHWFSVFSSGGLTCTDDYSLTLTTTGGPAGACYRATIITDKTRNSVTVSGAGSANTSGGTSSYSDNTTIYFSVEKTCSTAMVGDADVAYTVSYHL